MGLSQARCSTGLVISTCPGPGKKTRTTELRPLLEARTWWRCEGSAYPETSGCQATDLISCRNESFCHVELLGLKTKRLHPIAPARLTLRGLLRSDIATATSMATQPGSLHLEHPQVLFSLQGNPSIITSCPNLRISTGVRQTSRTKEAEILKARRKQQVFGAAAAGESDDSGTGSREAPQTLTPTADPTRIPGIRVLVSPSSGSNSGESFQF